jgi:hypothetical protein
MDTVLRVPYIISSSAGETCDVVPVHYYILLVPYSNTVFRVPYMVPYFQYWIFFYFHILICGYRTLSTVYYFLRRQGRPVTLYRCIISKSYFIGTVFEYRILSTVYYSLSTGETCDVVPVHTLLFCYKMALQSTCFGIWWFEHYTLTY